MGIILPHLRGGQLSKPKWFTWRDNIHKTLQLRLTAYHPLGQDTSNIQMACLKSLIPQIAMHDLTFAR